MCALSSHLFWAPVFTFWTRQPGSHRRKANAKEILISYLFLVFHLPSAVLAFSFSIARRVQHSLSLVYREVEFCVPTTESLSTVGCCARKKPRSLRDSNPRSNRQKVTRLPTEPPGRPTVQSKITRISLLHVPENRRSALCSTIPLVSVT